MSCGVRVVCVCVDRFLTAALQLKVPMSLVLLGYKSYVKDRPHRLLAACIG